MKTHRAIPFTVTLSLLLAACPRPTEPKDPGDDPGPADSGKSTETGGDPDPEPAAAEEPK